jgi:hypothetical protein
MVLLGLAVMLVLTATTSHAVKIQSGYFVVDLESYVPGEVGAPIGIPAAQVLLNPGFESAGLAPWSTSAWYVQAADAYTGSQCAESEGNEWIRQDFGPFDVNDVTLVAFWARQPDGPAFQAVDFYYGAADFDEFLVFPPHDWSYWDVTSFLRPVGTLIAIRIWGYSGGGSSPDITRIDDVVVDVNGATATEPSTWGAVKGLYR